jgi:hypothetical protein
MAEVSKCISSVGLNAVLQVMGVPHEPVTATPQLSVHIEDAD